MKYNFTIVIHVSTNNPTDTVVECLNFQTGRPILNAVGPTVHKLS